MSDLRQIPSVDQLLSHPHTEQLLARFGHAWTTAAIREVLADLRASFDPTQALPLKEDLVSAVKARLEEEAKPTLRPVINASGVLLHTNLGRAPLSQAALLAMKNAAEGYSTLEFDLETGKRAKRDVHAAALLTHLTGAEDALVVNNNAGAILLALSALTNRRKVAISRSNLVEIGGGFRIPDVMKQSGAKLLEVGTTNRTHLADYARAIEEGASALLYAHQSNFKILGFTSEPTLQELAGLAHDHALPLLVDLGSGSLVDTTRYGLAHEPTVQEVLASGADLVCFSGDKLLGGPQSGILLGSKDLLAKVRKHALYRALRADKLCLAALWATLMAYHTGNYENEIPLYQMLARDLADLQAQAAAWQMRLGRGSTLAGLSTIGGGSLPGETLPTWLLALTVRSPTAFLKRLRQSNPPVIARIENRKVVLDPRTVLPGQEADLLNTLNLLVKDEE